MKLSTKLSAKSLICGSGFFLAGMSSEIMTICKTYCMTQKIRSEINILLFQSQSIFTKIDLKFSLRDFPCFFTQQTELTQQSLC